MGKQIRLRWGHRAGDEYLLYSGTSVARLIVQKSAMLEHVSDVVEEEERMLARTIDLAWPLPPVQTGPMSSEALVARLQTSR